MKQRIHVIVLIMAFVIFVGCGQPSLKTMISTAQKQGINAFQEEIFQQFSYYEMGRDYAHFQEAFDSLIPIIVNNPKDTIFIFEWCNPPLLSYGVTVEKSTKQYYYYEPLFEEVLVISETDKELFQIIERWDKREIYEYSNSKPLVFDGNWLMESNLVTRLIFDKGQCIQAESIFFREIDLDCKASIKIIE